MDAQSKPRIATDRPTDRPQKLTHALAAPILDARARPLVRSRIVSLPLTTAEHSVVTAALRPYAADRQESEWSRAADHTAERLGLATLGYVAVTTLVITLAPFRFTLPAHGLFYEWTVFDLIMNVVMFLPLGFLFRVTRPRGSKNAWYMAIVMGAVLSACIETAQLFEQARYSSFFDVGTNTLGAAVGSLLFTIMSRRLRLNATAVSTLALELPLMGLVYLLVPLLWLVGLASSGTERTWLLLPLAAFGGAILGAVHGGYLKPAQRTGISGLLAASGSWFIVASVPGGRHNPTVIVVGTLVAMGVAYTQSLATARARRINAQRRFELPTLRLVLPLFALYLALGSLWPLTGRDSRISRRMVALSGN